MTTKLRVIDRAELQTEYGRLLSASCHALNRLHCAQDAFELGEGSKAEVDRARREYRKAHKASEAAEVAAYGVEEAARRNAEMDNLVAAIDRANVEWCKSPDFMKWVAECEAVQKYGARPTRHRGFTIIDGGAA